LLYLDNIVFSLQTVGGVSRFWSSLIKYLTIHNQHYRVINFKDCNKNKYFSELKFNNNSIIFDNTKSLFINKYLNYNIRNINKNDFNIFHSSYYRVSNNSNITNILTVHDFIYEKFHNSSLFSIPHILQKKLSISKASKIICVSDQTYKDLLIFYPNINRNNVSVIPNGVSFDKFIFSKYSKYFHSYNIQDDPYFLFIGNRTKEKGYYECLKFISMTKKKCIFVGKPFSDSEIKKLIELKINSHCFNFGYADDFSLASLYHFADFLFFPSIYEGFGIPIIEAMVSKCPVICSNIPLFHEITKNNALLFNSLEEAIHQSNELKKIKFRKDITSSAFKHSMKYSWDNIVKQYIELYENVKQ
jgi:glycosyltransferase involved in cell wall biosynthesis